MVAVWYIAYKNFVFKLVFTLSLILVRWNIGLFWLSLCIKERRKKMDINLYVEL
jgi:hypothetical protein